MDENKILSSSSVKTEALHPATEPLKTISDRRKALAKIGKFSAYVAPATIALIGSKPAHAAS